MDPESFFPRFHRRDPTAGRVITAARRQIIHDRAGSPISRRPDWSLYRLESSMRFPRNLSFIISPDRNILCRNYSLGLVKITASGKSCNRKLWNGDRLIYETVTRGISLHEHSADGALLIKEGTTPLIIHSDSGNGSLEANSIRLKNNGVCFLNAPEPEFGILFPSTLKYRNERALRFECVCAVRLQKHGSRLKIAVLLVQRNVLDVAWVP
ncbi:hypothetical protein EVAR_52580_1 [Eumeta japonica]|uniref:Uncharacterized protein n=1 Tax=Eumeta variegata TaxID=151549 RepID=A0A4C1YCR7_EUMVA|nr:hypothetical protein EVAR_52580_1 [Eumeta japonica]